jgi:CheY-like chemotaxis protein
MRHVLNGILLVDDDAGCNLFNYKIVENANITDRIAVRVNGQEAMSYILEENSRPADGSGDKPVTLILLDLNMPVMDGWEFLDAFGRLADSTRKAYRIVILTTSENTADQEKAEKHPSVLAYLAKPLTVGKLKDVLMAIHA